MNGITHDQIRQQYEKVKRLGWMPWFEDEAERAGTTVAHLLGFGSRESNLTNLRGDFRGGRYHGYGPLQCDIGTYPEAPKVWSPQNAKPFIQKGVSIYISKVNDTKACVGRRTSVRAKSFTGAPVEPDDLRRIATAAYNCGRWAHYHFSRGENVDSTTTGREYSRDVYDRAIEFAKLREADGEENALKQEIVLQGKYARDSVKKDAGIFYASRVKLPQAEPQEAAEELERADYEREEAVLPEDQTNPADADVSPAVVPSTRAFEPASDGLRSDPEAVDQQPVGNPSDNPPQTEAPPEQLNVEDWKPWCLRWLKRVWGLFTGGNGVQLSTFSFAALRDPDHWHLYAIAGGLVFLLTLFFVLLATVAIGLVLWHNRKEIVGYIRMAKESVIDRQKRDLCLVFEKK